MVNDNIPYEVVRKTLGHTDQNAIRSYARLDLEQLRGLSLIHISKALPFVCLPAFPPGVAKYEYIEF